MWVFHLAAAWSCGCVAHRNIESICCTHAQHAHIYFGITHIKANGAHKVACNYTLVWRLKSQIRAWNLFELSECTEERSNVLSPESRCVVCLYPKTRKGCGFVKKKFLSLSAPLVMANIKLQPFWVAGSGINDEKCGASMLVSHPRTGR